MQKPVFLPARSAQKYVNVTGVDTQHIIFFSSNDYFRFGLSSGLRSFNPEPGTLNPEPGTLNPEP
jgi:hypothetical protein